jgi:hypothetical protein
VLRRPVEPELAALVGVQDDVGDRLPPAAHRHRHGQGLVGQLGASMITAARSGDNEPSWPRTGTMEVEPA